MNTRKFRGVFRRATMKERKNSVNGVFRSAISERRERVRISSVRIQREGFEFLVEC